MRRRPVSRRLRRCDRARRRGGDRDGAVAAARHQRHAHRRRLSKAFRLRRRLFCRFVRVRVLVLGARDHGFDRASPHAPQVGQPQGLEAHGALRRLALRAVGHGVPGDTREAERVAAQRDLRRRHPVVQAHRATQRLRRAQLHQHHVVPVHHVVRVAAAPGQVRPVRHQEPEVGLQEELLGVCPPPRARGCCAATAAATAAVPTAAVPTADERTTPARRLGLARGRAEVQQEIRAHALAAAARRRRVGRSGTWRRRVSILAKTRGGGRTLTRARAGRAGAAATRAHVASTAVASAVTAAAAPCASAPAWPAPRLAARGDASPRVRGRRGRRASGRRGERRGVEVQPADSPSGVVRHGDAPRIDPRASTDAPHADVAGKPRGYYDAKGEVTSLRVSALRQHR